MKRKFTKMQHHIAHSLTKPSKIFSLPLASVVILGVAILGSVLLILANAATSSVTYSGHLNNKNPSAAYGVTPTATGNLVLQATFNTKLSAVTLTVKDAAGNTVGTQTGTTSPVTLTAPITANASYTTIISGSGNGNYVLNISYPTQTAADTTAPTAPSNLVSTSQTASSTTLTWTASTDNVGVTGYDIYRGTTKVGSSTATTYTDSGLTAATSYSYYVKAKDAAGNTSASSNTVTATTAQAAPSDTQAPTAPTNLASPSQTTTTISLSWSGSTDNVGVTGYDIYRGTTKVGSISSAVANAYTDSGLTAGTSYSYSVKARDAAGNVSAASNTVTASTKTADTTKPTITITTPTNGATAAGVISVSGSVSDNVGLPTSPVTLQIDSGAIITPGFSGSGASLTYSYSWDTTQFANGSHTITATAKDTSGNTSTISISVTVSNQTSSGDTIKPYVGILTASKPLHGTATGFSFQSYDFETGVSRAEYAIGSYARVPISITPGQSFTQDVTVDSTKYADGTYYLTVYSYDAAGNVGQGSVQVIVSNTAHYEHKIFPDGMEITINSIGINPKTNTYYTADWIHDMLATCAGGSASDFSRIAAHHHVTLDDQTGTATVAGASGSNGTYYDYSSSTGYHGIDGAFANEPYQNGCYEYGHAWNGYYLFLVNGHSYAPYLNERWVTADGSTTLATKDVCANTTPGGAYTVDGYSGCMSFDHCQLFALAPVGGYCYSNRYMILANQQPDLKNWMTNIWTKDHTGPSLSISSPTNGSTYSGSQTASGYATDSFGIQSITIQFDGGPARTPTVTALPSPQGGTYTSSTSSWSYPINSQTLSSGTHTMTVTATDPSGNKTSKTITFTDYL